jgi:hypothetical protein
MARCGNCVYFDDYGSGEGRCTYFDISMDSGISACDHYEDAYGDSYGDSSDGCFLTSACVEYMGKADDCAELATLRAFRDGYMASTDDGKALINEYYAVAPAIARKIQRSDKASEYFQDIYQTILRCIDYIKQGNNESAIAAYREMVLKYKTICA